MLSAVTYLTLGALLMRVQSRWIVKAYVLALAGLTTLLIGAIACIWECIGQPTCWRDGASGLVGR